MPSFVHLPPSHHGTPLHHYDHTKLPQPHQQENGTQWRISAENICASRSQPLKLHVWKHTRTWAAEEQNPTDCSSAHSQPLRSLVVSFVRKLYDELHFLIFRWAHIVSEKFTTFQLYLPFIDVFETHLHTYTHAPPPPHTPHPPPPFAPRQHVFLD